MVIVASVVVAFTAGCAGPSTPVPMRPSDVGATYIAPSGTGARTINGLEYKYVATAERRAQIIAGYRKLKLGQSREEVRAALGLPDRAQTMYDKRGRIFYGWDYDYDIKMRWPGPNIYDVQVSLFFNPEGKLRRALPCHIPGLKALGGPSWESIHNELLTASRRGSIGVAGHRSGHGP
jgi:hypothetical protein